MLVCPGRGEWIEWTAGRGEGEEQARHVFGCLSVCLSVCNRVCSCDGCCLEAGLDGALSRLNPGWRCVCESCLCIGVLLFLLLKKQWRWATSLVEGFLDAWSVILSGSLTESMAHCASALGCQQQSQGSSRAVVRRANFNKQLQQQQQQQQQRRRQRRQQQQQQQRRRRRQQLQLQLHSRCQYSAQGDLSQQQPPPQPQLQSEGLRSDATPAGIRQRRSRNKLRGSVAATVSGNIAAATGQQSHYSDDIPSAVMSTMYGAPRWNLEEGRQYYEDMIFHRGPLYQVG